MINHEGHDERGGTVWFTFTLMQEGDLRQWRRLLGLCPTDIALDALTSEGTPSEPVD